MSDGKFAVLRFAGKQHKVSVGEKITVQCLVGKAGESVTLDEVLMVSDGDKVSAGTPLVSGASIKAKVIALGRAEKRIIYKKRRRKGYTKKQGHRQDQTKLQIESINA